MTQPVPPRDSIGYIPWWLLALVTAGFAVVALITAGLILSTRPTAPALAATPTAILLTATAVPTQPPKVDAPTPTSIMPSPEPTFTAPPPPPGDVRVGVYVQVTGTGDTGFLNLRAEPGVGYLVNYLALEREVLQVQAGPTEADGFVWWYLVNPQTNSYGWGVQNYLQVVIQ